MTEDRWTHDGGWSAPFLGSKWDAKRASDIQQERLTMKSMKNLFHSLQRCAV